MALASEGEGEEDIPHRLSLVVEAIPLHRHPNLDTVLLHRHRIVGFLLALALALAQSAMGRGTISLDLTTSDIFPLLYTCQHIFVGLISWNYFTPVLRKG